jgi:hypothetical protein
MATITNATLTIAHDHEKKLATPVVKCKVRFTELELCQMKNCPRQKMFKLKCQLWGEDGFFTGSDDHLFNYANVFYFPDPTPAAAEDRTFTVTVGEGVLDEDWGEDEVYGKLILQNLLTGSSGSKKTNVVSHHF